MVTKTNKARFEDLNQARSDAGLLVSDTCKILDISFTTWRRWGQAGQVPRWAYNHIKLLSGDLALLGWSNWQIRNGVLYEKSLNPRYHSWRPEDLLAALFNRAGS